MRRLTALVAGVVFATAACIPTPPPPPPPPPPLGGTAGWVGDLTHQVRDGQGNLLCMASLSTAIVLNDARSMTVYSDVIVRGTGASGRPCNYNVWAFRYVISCDDITADGCGDWQFATPNGDLYDYSITVAFRHRPDHATLGLTFDASWGLEGGRRGTARTRIIRCELPTRGNRCLFQPLN